MDGEANRVSGRPGESSLSVVICKDEPEPAEWRPPPNAVRASPERSVTGTRLTARRASPRRRPGPAVGESRRENFRGKNLPYDCIKNNFVLLSHRDATVYIDSRPRLCGDKHHEFHDYIQPRRQHEADRRGAPHRHQDHAGRDRPVRRVPPPGPHPGGHLRHGGHHPLVRQPPGRGPGMAGPLREVGHLPDQRVPVRLSPGPGERAAERHADLRPRGDHARRGSAPGGCSPGLPGRGDRGGLGMSAQVVVQGQGRQPRVVTFTTTSLEWLDAMREEYNRRFEHDLTIEQVLDYAIISEIWSLSRDMYLSEEQTFRIGIQGESVGMDLSTPFSRDEIIFAYTRTDAIRDGVLVDSPGTSSGRQASGSRSRSPGRYGTTSAPRTWTSCRARAWKAGPGTCSGCSPGRHPGPGTPRRSSSAWPSSWPTRTRTGPGSPSPAGPGSGWLP